MARKYYTRLDIQNILETNHLNAPVSYLDREDENPQNVIVYYLLSANPSDLADDKVHIRKKLVQVNHYKQRKLDSIEKLMIENFICEATAFNIKQIDTDYWGDYYQFEIFTGGDW